MSEQLSYTHGEFSWVDLATEETDKARDFYSALFGLTFRDELEGDEVVYTLGLKDDKPVLGLLQKPQEMREQCIPNVWETYISVNSADEALAEVTAAGGTPMGPVMEPSGAGRMAVVADPSGAVVMLWEAIGQDGAAIKGAHGTLCWNQLVSSDVEAALAFYSEILGWQSTPLDMEGGVGITLEGEMIASAGPLPAPGIPSHWQVYFAVNDCDATTELCQELGGQVIVPPMDTPPGRMAQLVDDTGAVFWVITPDPTFSPD